MEKHRFYVNYRKLWVDIQNANRFNYSFTTMLRAGNSYFVYNLCERYKTMLNDRRDWEEALDPEHMPALYVSSYALRSGSPYHIKSITNCMEMLQRLGVQEIIEVKTVFNSSKFKVVIPLRYFHKLSDVAYLDHNGKPRERKYYYLR